MDRQDFENKIRVIFKEQFLYVKWCTWSDCGCHKLFLDNFVWFHELEEFSKLFTISNITPFEQNGRYWLEVHFYDRVDSKQ